MRKFKGLYLEVTRQCNLRCIHCYNESGEKYEMEEDKIIELINSAYSLNPEFDLALSGGEFFTYSKYQKIIDYCIVKKIHTTIVTNGTLIDSDFIKKIRNYDNIKIQVSLDGVESVNDIIRGKGTFKKIDTLFNLLNDNKIISKVSVHYVINNLNYCCIEDTIEYLFKKGIKTIDFNMIVNQGRTLDNHNILSFDNYKQKYIDIKEQISKIEEKYKDMNIDNIDITYSCPIFNDENADFYVKVDTFGNLYLCQLFNGDHAVIGNIYENNLLQILKSKNVDIFIKKIRDLFINNENCKKCLWKVCCNRGCPAMHFTNAEASNYYADCDILKNNYIKVLKNGLRK